MPHLPIATMKDLALVVILVADVAWDGVKETLARLRPHFEPPADLEITSSVGGLYTGILLVDRNEVLAGLVIRTGHEPPPSPPPRFSPPPPTTSRFGSPISRSTGWRSDTLAARFADDDDETNDGEGLLSGWADDPREDRWRR